MKKILASVSLLSFCFPFGDVQASCNIDADLAPYKSLYRSGGSIASGSLCGQPFTVSPGTKSALEGGKTISGTIAGFPVTITTEGSSLAHPGDNDIFTVTLSGVQIFRGSEVDLRTMARNNQTLTLSVGGQPFTVTTNASDIDNIKDANTVTVTYGGRTIFSGLGSAFGVQDALNLLGSIGILDSGSATQQQVNRTTSQVVANVVSTRISAALSKATLSGSRQKGPGTLPGKLPDGQGRKDSSGLTAPITGFSSGDMQNGSKGV